MQVCRKCTRLIQIMYSRYPLFKLRRFMTSPSRDSFRVSTLCRFANWKHQLLYEYRFDLPPAWDQPMLPAKRSLRDPILWIKISKCLNTGLVLLCTCMYVSYFQVLVRGLPKMKDRTPGKYARVAPHRRQLR